MDREFFWDNFDLTVTRFSGRSAPPHAGGLPNLADWVTREAYSHELFSVGWWPGNEAYPEPAFYGCVYPEPDGLAGAEVVAGAYHRAMGELLLPWPVSDGVGTGAEDVLAVFHSAYSAAAELAGWRRGEMEGR